MQLSSPLQGLIAAPFTPMLPNGSVDFDRVAPYFRFLQSNGVSGAFICGSTGEGPSLTQQEKLDLTAAWMQAKADDPGFTVILLTGGNTLADCVQLARESAALGVDAIAFTSPSYFKPASVRELARMCLQVCEAAPELPFYYYHIPVLTGAAFPMIELLEAVHGQAPNFRGIKYTHEDLADFLACRQFAGNRYDMLWGRDETMLAALASGARAAVGSTFNYLAPLYHQLMQQYELGRLEEARELQHQSIRFIRLLGKYGGIPVGKAYMRLIGMDCGPVRLPLTSVSEQLYQPFSEEALSLGLRHFQSTVATPLPAAIP